MTAQEKLSAFLDDTLNDSSDHMSSGDIDQWLNPDNKEILSRYAMIGSVIKHQGNAPLASTGLADSIAKIIEQEPVIETQVAAPAANEAISPRLWIASAASVAVVAVALWFGINRSQDLDSFTLSADKVAVTESNQVEIREALVATNKAQLAEDQRDLLAKYMAEHAKYGGTLAFVPSLRAVSYTHEK